MIKIKTATKKDGSIMIKCNSQNKSNDGWLEHCSTIAYLIMRIKEHTDSTDKEIKDEVKNCIKQMEKKNEIEK